MKVEAMVMRVNDDEIAAGCVKVEEINQDVRIQDRNRKVHVMR